MRRMTLTLSHRYIRSLVGYPSPSTNLDLTICVGGNAFNATMTGDIGEQGTCTTCTYTEGMIAMNRVEALYSTKANFVSRFLELLDRHDVL
jgi:hypothetical protein